MLALKARYEKGRIQLLEPMPDGIDKAELHIIVIPSVKGENPFTPPTQEYYAQLRTSEEEFKEIGLATFFDTEDDADIDWEDYFGLK